MNLHEIITNLHLHVLTDPHDFANIEVESGYTSDLLSCVMTGASSRCVWVTLIAHNNVVAVAALLDVAAVIITEHALPDEATIQKANEQGIILLSTPHPSFHVIGQLWEMGLRAN